MDISSFAFRLLLLFFPGILCHQIVDGLTNHKERKAHEIFLLSFVFGIVSYLFYGLASILCQLLVTAVASMLRGIQQFSPKLPLFFSDISSSNSALNFSEILWVAFTSIFLAFALAKSINSQFLIRAGQLLRVTNRFGESCVWAHALNRPEIRWATVRLVKHKLMYQGYIRAFSDDEESKELFLSDVIAYNEETGGELYRSPHVYVSITPGEVIVDFPDIDQVIEGE